MSVVFNKIGHFTRISGKCKSTIHRTYSFTMIWTSHWHHHQNHLSPFVYPSKRLPIDSNENKYKYENARLRPACVGCTQFTQTTLHRSVYILCVWLYVCVYGWSGRSSQYRHPISRNTVSVSAQPCLLSLYVLLDVRVCRCVLHTCICACLRICIEPMRNQYENCF